MGTQGRRGTRFLKRKLCKEFLIKHHRLGHKVPADDVYGKFSYILFQESVFHTLSPVTSSLVPVTLFLLFHLSSCQAVTNFIFVRGEESREEEIPLLLSCSFSFSETFSFTKKKNSEKRFIKIKKISRYFNR